MLALPATCPVPAAASDLLLRAEPEIYAAVDKLYALGRLPGFLANTRPYSVEALRIAASRALEGSDAGEFDDALARWVVHETSEKYRLRTSVALAWSESAFVPRNNAGIPVPECVSATAEIAARADPSTHLGGHLSAAAVLGEGRADDEALLDTAVEAGWRYFSIQAGKISAWYGPGRHGAIIFSNNAPPFPGIRVHNREPIPLPGFLSFLGHFQYDMFVARLDRDRPVPEPLLWGMRIALRPSRFFEIGISRSIQFGGEGRDESGSAWWDVFTGTRSETKDNGNQLAGADLTLLLPFRIQPVQLYLEAAGEDYNPNYRVVAVPYKYGWLAGVFLPSIGRNARADLRLEAATNHWEGRGPIWYVHPDYPHEYKGRILGHPMGTDATDFSAAFRYFLLPSSYLQAEFGLAKRHGSAWTEKISRRGGVSLVAWLTRSVRVEGRAAWESAAENAGVREPDVLDGLAASAKLAFDL